MKIFATKFLEEPALSTTKEKWNWKPANRARDIYASGAPTATRQSTYAAEKDDISDTDRPNEGLLIAA